MNRAKTGAAIIEFLSSIEEMVEDARNGRMFILVDAEDRENEGDLVIPAQMATPDADQLHGQARPRPDLPRADAGARQAAAGCELMSRSQPLAASDRLHRLDRGARRGHRPASRRTTAPTPSPSPSIRPRTTATTSSRRATSFRWSPATAACWSAPATPRRPSIIARLAGLYPAGVICEIMNDDGTMARLPDLVAFAQRHGLKIGTIADLIAYRLRYDHLVERSCRDHVRQRLWRRASSSRSMPPPSTQPSMWRWSRATSNPAAPVLVRVHALEYHRRRASAGTSARDPIHKAMRHHRPRGQGRGRADPRVAPRLQSLRG